MKQKASAVWTGGIKDGAGKISTASGALDQVNYGFKSRFENGPGTNPEELIGAAHAGCFSMALSAALTKAGFRPDSIRTHASVHLDKQGEGFAITQIKLETLANIPGIDEASFQRHAEDAKANCPVSKALAGVKIELSARLETATSLNA